MIGKSDKIRAIRAKAEETELSVHIIQLVTIKSYIIQLACIRKDLKFSRL
jgi:hypothetical protein